MAKGFIQKPFFWCPEPESNRHSRNGRGILSPFKSNNYNNPQQTKTNYSISYMASNYYALLSFVVVFYRSVPRQCPMGQFPHGSALLMTVSTSKPPILSCQVFGQGLGHPLQYLGIRFCGQAALKRFQRFKAFDDT